MSRRWHRISLPVLPQNPRIAPGSLPRNRALFMTIAVVVAPVSR